MGKLKFSVEKTIRFLRDSSILRRLWLWGSQTMQEPEAAANFLRFLLSEQVQMMLPKWKTACHFAERTDGGHPCGIKLWIQPSGKNSEPLRLPGEFMQTSLWLRFAIYDIRQEVFNRSA